MIVGCQQKTLAHFGEFWPSSASTRRTGSPQLRETDIAGCFFWESSFGQADRYSLQVIDFIAVVWRNCPDVAQ